MRYSNGAGAELNERIKAEIRRRLAECIEREMRSNGARLDMDLIASCIHCAAEGTAFDWTIDTLMTERRISPLGTAQSQGKG